VVLAVGDAVKDVDVAIEGLRRDRVTLRRYRANRLNLRTSFCASEHERADVNSGESDDKGDDAAHGLECFPITDDSPSAGFRRSAFRLSGLYQPREAGAAGTPAPSRLGSA